MKLHTQHLLNAAAFGLTALLGGNAHAQATTTSLAGWLVDGDVVVQNNTTITLTTAFADGDPNGDQPYNLSGASAVDIGTLETDAGVPTFALDLSAEQYGTEGSLIAQSFAVQAGQTLSFDWSFSTFETLFEDRAFVVIDGQVITLATLSAPGAATQSFSHLFAQSGTATLALGVLDTVDTAGVSLLSVSNLQLVGSTPPVPEPATHALLLGGLGLLGFVATRRRARTPT